jgi:hypothetical protein
MPPFTPADPIQNRIHLVRGHHVLLHTDLARFYGVSRSRLLRMAQRFPGEFCFLLEHAELFNWPDGDPKCDPIYGFTEHGALAAAYTLNMPATIAMSHRVLRVFVQLRQRGVAPRTHDQVEEPLPLPPPETLVWPPRETRAIPVSPFPRHLIDDWPETLLAPKRE